MNIPQSIIGPFITLLMGAQARGYLDVRSLEPLLKIVVDSGNAQQLHLVMDEIETILLRLETDAGR